MNILFLTHYFPPEVNAPATRTFEHAKVWVESGHSVSVLTSFPNAPKGKVFEGYKQRLHNIENIDGIDVHRIATYIAPNKGFSKRILNYLSYFLMSITLCWKVKKVDVIVSTSPQFFCGLAGYFVSLLRGVPWVLEVRDLWPESIVAVGAMKDSIITRCLYKLEYWAYKKADKIVVVTEAFRDYIKHLGIQASKIEVIKNGANLALYDPDRLAADPLSLKHLADFRAAYQVCNKFTIAYVGTHGMAHGLEIVCAAAELLKAEPDIQFLMVGDGAEREKLLAMKVEKKLDNLIFLGQLSKQRMPLIWMLTDVSLIHLRKSDTFKTVIPSKMFEAMAMSRPIILGVEGESQALLTNANAGICIPPGDAKALAKAVMELYTSSDKVKCMGESGRAFVKAYYDRVSLAQQYLKVLGALLDKENLNTKNELERLT